METRFPVLRRQFRNNLRRQTLNLKRFLPRQMLVFIVKRQLRMLSLSPSKYKVFLNNNVAVGDLFASRVQLNLLSSWLEGRSGKGDCTKHQSMSNGWLNKLRPWTWQDALLEGHTLKTYIISALALYKRPQINRWRVILTKSYLLN